MTAHIAIVHPNSPSKPPRYEGSIDCEQTAIWWGETMQQAERVRAMGDRLCLELAKLEQQCRDNGISCEDDMEASMVCTLSDLSLDGLISRINEEVSRFEDR